MQARSSSHFQPFDVEHFNSFQDFQNAVSPKDKNAGHVNTQPTGQVGVNARQACQANICPVDKKIAN